jgi:hypothetical protein
MNSGFGVRSAIMLVPVHSPSRSLPARPWEGLANRPGGGHPACVDSHVDVRWLRIGRVRRGFRREVMASGASLDVADAQADAGGKRRVVRGCDAGVVGRPERVDQASAASDRAPHDCTSAVASPGGAREASRAGS